MFFFFISILNIRRYTYIIFSLFQILAKGEWQIPFILELEQIGCDYHHAPLRDTAHQLTHILPPHQHTVSINDSSESLKPTVIY